MPKRKEHFTHCAKVILEPGSDERAPGGAVTIALCGSWDHEGACRWPHHTAATWDGLQGDLRVVFAAHGNEEEMVRSLIEHGLARGECVGPDAKLSRWSLMESGAGIPTDDEDVLAERISGTADKG